MKCSSIVLLDLLSFIQFVRAQIELKDFYPYGPEKGDTAVPTNDDGSTGKVNIVFPFPFFDEDHKSLFVNTNGVISFLVEVSQFRPDAFPLTGQRRLIAPFWADVDTTEGGTVYYRETQDHAILTRASEEIRKYFVRQKRFNAKWVMVVTWLDVAPYGGASFKNTFQTILVTDGFYSFSIFCYNKIEWTYGTASNNISAQAGFNAGDGIRYFNVPHSRTSQIINIASTSNYQVPGLWIFQVDGETVKNTGCTKIGGKLVLSPRSGIELGGTKVFIGGPCYSPDDQIKCRFNNTIETTGVYVSTEEAYCITPPLYIVGRLPVDVSLDGGATFNFTGSFRSIPLGRNPPDIQGLDVKYWANSSSTVINWDSNAVNSSHVDIEIFVFDVFEFRLIKDSLASFKDISNSGSYKLDFSERNIDLNRRKRRRRRRTGYESPIAIVSVTSSSRRVKRLVNTFKVTRLFSSTFLVSWLVLDGYCNIWYRIQSRDVIASLQEELPPCPTSLRAMRVDGENFIADSGIKRLLSDFYHPGSSLCYRSRTASPSGAGQQCCYNDKGSLMVGPLGGGTLDIASPDENFWGHMGQDVLPWFSCCKLTSQCYKYYQRRPSDDGSRYSPPRVAATRGDPHLATFDGIFYTFNGFGEYVLLQVNDRADLQFQGRMTTVVDDQGRPTKATALTALVLKAAGSDIVQVEFNSRRGIDVHVNSERAEFDEQSRLDFTGVFVIKQNRSKIGIYFNSGVSIVTKAIEDFLTYEISIPTRFKGQTAGLLGLWDDNKDQEFLLPNGSFIHTNSSSRTLHYEFGQKWLVKRNQTLFTYKIGESYETFLKPLFTPVFVDDTTSLFLNPTLEKEAKDVCGTNKECLFDIAVTGKKSVGEATLESFNELQQRINESQVVATPILFGCDGIENSPKQTDACGVCDGDNSTCTDCQGNITPDFVNNRTCDFYHAWGEWSVCFDGKKKMMSTRNRTCSIKSGCRHLGEDVQYMNCTCVECNNKDDDDADNDANDDDGKTLGFYLLAAGLPVLVFILLLAVLLLWRFRKKNSDPNTNSQSVMLFKKTYAA